MHSVSPLFSSGLVYSPANLIKTFDKFGREKVDVREFQWVEEVVRQCNRTPRGKQDLVDCVSAGLLWLRGGGFLELEHEFIKAEAQAGQHREALRGRLIGAHDPPRCAPPFFTAVWFLLSIICETIPVGLSERSTNQRCRQPKRQQ